MLEALLSGEVASSGQLARHAGVTAQTASGHLANLVSARLVTRTVRGRFRDYALAGPSVAEAVEALMRLATPVVALTAGQGQAGQALRRARTCYDHLAGELGVAVTEAMVRRKLLTFLRGSYAMTAAGRRWLAALGIELPPAQSSPRPLLRACLDWSERRPHLAGVLGARLAAAFFRLGWIRRVRGSRAVRVTDFGSKALLAHLGLCAALSLEERP